MTMETTQTGTPGRWFSSEGGILAEDQGHDRKWAAAMAGTDDPAEPYGVKVAENVTPEDARLIVAAVNAVREAGYTVEELEAGAVKIDRERPHVRYDVPPTKEDYASMTDFERELYPPESFYRPTEDAAALRADLAACREALRSLVQWMQDSGSEKTPAGGHGAFRYEGTEYGVVTGAGVLLARLDADSPR